MDQPTKRTSMQLLWLLPLVASFLLPATGEVVQDFELCKQFFLDGKPPTLEAMDPARICQFYKDKYRFATMYDKKGRIPIFSAYKYQPGKGRRKNNWMIEPQLALPEDQTRRSMESERTCKINKERLKNSQAVSEDYKGAAVFDRGHLLPVSHQPDQHSRDATFTLTNVVPQFQELNQGKWAAYERSMKTHTTGCLHTYVLVGAVPGDKFIARSRVNIPSHMWAAACCVGKQKKKKSWGVMAENNQNQIVQRRLRDLEQKLAKLYKKEINLFNGACYSAKELWVTNTTHPGYKT